MAQSTIYIYRKENNFIQETFGFYQSGFNFSLTIDETKDSAKIIVLTRNTSILKPNTIVRLEGINAWWCVKKDTSQRHESEGSYLYEHTIQLQGAFEILNSRDLINCGFNVDHYSVGQFLQRLISLSSFELPITFDFGTSLSNTKVVDFLKTFENYTLASAIKEFLNGYNCIPKMIFNITNNRITSATIKIYSKSGLADTPLNENVFNEISAVDNIDRESYGAKVISNIQNCVARKSLRFPRTGGFYFVGENGYITYDNASQSKLLLPSKVYAVESITLYGELRVEVAGGNIYLTPDDMSRDGKVFKRQVFERLADEEISQSAIDYIENNWNTIFNILKSIGSRTILNGGYYDAIEDAPHGDYLTIGNNRPDGHNCRLYLNNERYAYNNDESYEWVISWKQGSNEIKGLAQAIAHAQKPNTIQSSWFLNDAQVIVSSQADGNIILVDQNATSLRLIDDTLHSVPNAQHLLVSVNYIPMSDIKFKTDNNVDDEDTKLYNQNGKLVDSYAVSKLVNSYCKSIRDKELVRFGIYYNFNYIPKLGARVGEYVINNISYDVYDNENGGFAYKCQFSLNLYSACKSIMINANTNIRDYDCPQSNNIKRIQNYRDFIELSYENVTYGNTFMDIDKIINISLAGIGMKDNFVFVMRAKDPSFDNEGDNHSTMYYYHLDHISFDLCKQKKFVVDFGDNNIIGYGNAHAYKPITLGNIFDLDKSITIPISYVNNYGEVEGLELLACEEDIAETNFGTYPISRTVAIDSDIYDNFESNYNLKISEPNYEKDGLEIPVFEYSCEISGDDNIEVADDFFEYEEGYEKFVAIKSTFPITNENQTIVSSYEKYDCSITNNQGQLTIELTNGTPSVGQGHWGIYAKKGNDYRFLFALNDYPSDFENNSLIAYLNCYKLK